MTAALANPSPMKSGRSKTGRMVSVVIPTHQRRASLERALRALSRQALAPHEYEVIVAIDGSTDGTRESVEAMRTPYALR